MDDGVGVGGDAAAACDDEVHDIRLSKKTEGAQTSRVCCYR